MEDAADTDKKKYVLKLFVSGASPNSVRAIGNLKRICDRYLTEKYDLEIIDVHQDGITATKEEIVALPLLIRKKPLPAWKLVGDMSDTEKVLAGLGIVE